MEIARRYADRRPPVAIHVLSIIAREQIVGDVTNKAASKRVSCRYV
jgi:hypothetical protein